MATTQEKQKQTLAKEIETLKLKITQASNTLNNTSASDDSKATIQKRVSELNARLKSAKAEINAIELTEKETKKIDAGEIVVTPKMQQVGINEDILKEMQALGANISPEAFSSGGIASTTLVYLGKKQAIVSPTGAKKLTFGQRPDVQTTNNVYKQFWDNAAVKAKVKAAMVSSGISNVNDINAYEQWKLIVNKSAELYAAGNGISITPMDVLNQTISPSGPDIPRKTVQQVDPLVKNAIVRTVYQNVLGRNETQDELTKSLKAVDKMINSGTITTTKRVGGKYVTTSTPGFSETAVAESIAKSIKGATEGPVAQDLKEKQSLDFMDFLNGLRG